MGESVFPINENSIGLVAMALAGRKRPHNKVSPIPLNKRIEKPFFVFAGLYNVFKKSMDFEPLKNIDNKAFL